MSIIGPDKDGYIYEIFHRINKDGFREKVTRKYQPKNDKPDTEAFLFKLRRKHHLLKPFGKISDNEGCTMVSPDHVYITDSEELDNTVAILKKNLTKVKMKRTRNWKTVPTYKPPISTAKVTQLRISNLTKDAEEMDLRELFKSFGRITRVFIAKEDVTGESRGFAFVTFQERDDAERALEQLNGHGYGYLILKVEWAKPRKINQRAYYSGYGKALPQTSKK